MAWWASSFTTDRPSSHGRDTGTVTIRTAARSRLAAWLVTTRSIEASRFGVELSHAQSRSAASSGRVRFGRVSGLSLSRDLTASKSACCVPDVRFASASTDPALMLTCFPGLVSIIALALIANSV